MDNLINKANEDLNKYKQTHPILTNLWREYIDIKIKNLENTIAQFHKTAILMETIDDISNENIVALHLLALLNNETELT